MQSNSDFEDLLLAFNAEKVSYLIIGAYAIAVYARPRATGDIDIWVEATVENARRVYRALAAFGASMNELDERTFSAGDVVFQTGIAPVRIDAMTKIDGVSFAEAWPDRIASNLGAVPTNVVGRDALLLNKRVSGHPKNFADIERLERDR